MSDRDTPVADLEGVPQFRFFKPVLSAFPNPIVVVGRAASVPTGKTVLSWSLRAAGSADLYGYPPGGGEQFLGTKTKDGSLQSGPIHVGETFRWKLFPRGSKAMPYDEVAVTAQMLDLNRGAGPVGHPDKRDNVFLPTNLVSRAQWYSREHSAFVPGGGLWTRGLGPELDRVPTPDEVVVGYLNHHETQGWFGGEDAQYDTFWRGGVQFDASAIQAYVQRWGIGAATLQFRVSRDDWTCLARIEQAAQDMTDWEPLASGVLPSDGTYPVELHIGPLVDGGHTSSYWIRPNGVISANVWSITDRWPTFWELPHAFALMGMYEEFPEEDTSSCITHYSDFSLEIQPSPFR